MSPIIMWDEDVFTWPGFLEASRCLALIGQAEALGFEDAPITTAAGPVMASGVRNNTRVMLDDAQLAAWLWQALQPQLPPSWATRPGPPGQRWRAVGLNERLRFYRYEPGQRFKMHSDGCFERHARERSHMTVLVTLNDQVMGGQTRILTRAKALLEFAPATGQLLCFRHELRHEGALVEAGRKEVLRTDLMYRLEEIPG